MSWARTALIERWVVRDAGHTVEMLFVHHGIVKHASDKDRNDLEIYAVVGWYSLMRKGWI